MIGENGEARTSVSAEFPAPRDFEFIPYRKTAHMRGNPRKTRSQNIKYYARKPQISPSTHSVNRHIDNMRAVGLLITVAGAVLFLALAIALFGNASPAFKSLGDSIDAMATNLIGHHNTSTPRSEWKKGTMPYLYQTDPQWADIEYGGGHISDYGCGPTCLSMVYIFLTGKADKTPNVMGRYSEENGYLDQGITSWLLMGQGAKALGMQSYEIGTDEDQIRGLLERGCPIICSVRPGDFTTVGHFIVLCGTNDDGTIEIRDPNSPEKSKQSWELSQITKQCNNLWAYS